MSEKAKAHKYRKALWKGSIKVALIITVVILFFLGVVIFLLSSITILKLNVIVDGINSCQILNNETLSMYLSEINVAGHGLINSNTLTFLIGALSIIVIGWTLFNISTINERLHRYDKLVVYFDLNQRIIEITAQLNYSIVALKGCLITDQSTNITNYLDEIKSTMEQVIENGLGMSEAMLRRLNGVLEEVYGAIQKKLRKRRKEVRGDASERESDWEKAFISRIDEIRAHIGSEAHQKRMIRTYEKIVVLDKIIK